MDKKNVGIVSGVCGIMIGILILICAVADLPLPKLVLVIFAVVCMINAVLIMLNYKRKE